MPGETAKVCALCGADCSNKARTKDARGRYFCKSCYEKATANRPAAAASAAITEATPMSHRAAMLRDDPADAGEYGLEPSAAATPKPRPPAPVNAPIAKTQALPVAATHALQAAPKEVGPPAACPSCDEMLEAGAAICVPCGIRIDSGRSVLTAETGDIELMHERTREVIWFVSWLMWFGLLPVWSEAHGSCKPWAIRFIALLTFVVSASVWVVEWLDLPAARSTKNLMMWVGTHDPEPEQIEALYHGTSWGDRKAYERKKYELRESVPEYELPIIAHSQLRKSQQVIGEFRWWQPLTCAFLHGGFMHFAGNMLFLIVFGTRVNAMVGNVGTLVLYPLLAIASAVPEIWLMSDMPPTPTLGASGAIFGLAGMYLMLFPTIPVHVAAFIRVPILLLGIFKRRGFWILLYYVGWDVLMTVLQAEDGVAHWAHMSGFFFGLLFAFILLASRGVNSRGCDLVSRLIGKHAWGILGKPVQWRRMGEPEGWMTRMRIIPAGAMGDREKSDSE